MESWNRLAIKNIAQEEKCRKTKVKNFNHVLVQQKFYIFQKSLESVLMILKVKSKEFF